MLSNSTVNDRVFRWKQKIQEFGPILNYIKGHKNIEADALSRLPIAQDNMEIMLNHPPSDPYNPLLNKNPMDLSFIQHYQMQDQALLKALKEDNHFSRIYRGSLDLIHFQYQDSSPPKVVIPQALQLSTVRWLHSLLGHAGITRLSATLRKHFWFPNMQEFISQFVQKCEYCQKYNKQVIKYGQLPPKRVKNIQPWEEVHVDMIGPWRITINAFEYEFRALTCIDSVIGLPEIIPVENATSSVVVQAFENNWLSRYPSPSKCVHDNGNEFLGPAFSNMLRNNNIKSVPTTVKNPQSNAIVERMHQSISTMLAISLRENPPNKFEEVSTLVHNKCMAAQYAVRATVNTNLKYTPGELAFGRSMLHPFPSKIDWPQLLKDKQTKVNNINLRENQGRKTFDYQVGQKVLILNKNIMKGKLEPTVLDEGPWTISKVHTNGTISILRNKYLERINIRRVRPFFE